MFPAHFTISTVRGLRGIAILAAVMMSTAAGVPSTHAQQPQESDSAPLEKLAEVAAAIKRLHSDKFNVRQTAHEQLLKAGVDAIGSLESATQSERPEVAARALQILVELGRDKQASDDALAALERIVKQDANQAAKAAAALADLRMTDADRALAALQAAGARVTVRGNGEVFSARVSSDAEVAVLKHLKKVHSVSVRGNAVTDIGIKHLADVKGMTRLTIFDCGMTGIGLAALKDLKELESLSILTSRNPQYQAEDLHVLQHLPRLDRLSLHRLKGDLRVLLELKRVSSLSLSEVDLNETNVGAINQLTRLRNLSISLQDASEADLRKVSEIKVPLSLSVMSIRDQETDAWRHLHGKQIKNLSLASDSITDDVLFHVGKITSLESLLVIRGNVTDEGLSHLRGLKALRTVRFMHTKVTEEGLAKLRRDLPNLDRADNDLRAAMIAPRAKIGFSDDPQTGSKNAHLRERLKPKDVVQLQQEPKLGTVFLNEKLQDEDLRLLKAVKMQGIVINSPLITDTGIGHLKNHPTLERVQIWQSKTSDASLKIIGEMPQLTAVRFEEPAFSNDGLRELISQLAKHGRVRNLSLLKTSITNEGLEKIDELKSLEQLFLNSNRGISSEVFSKIATLTNLTRLEMNGVALTEADLPQLSQLTKLETLGLSNTTQDSLSNRGLAHLCRVKSLKSLTIVGAQIDDEGVKHLTRLDQLERLGISETNVTDQGIEMIADKLPNLTRLVLSGTKVTDAGMVSVAKLTKLEWLWLAETKVGGEGLSHLDGLKALRLVQISAGQVSSAAQERFRQHHPDARLMMLR